MLPAHPYHGIMHMTGVKRYIYLQGVLNFAMHFMQKDQGNKVTEDNDMMAIITTMRDKPQDPEWTLLGHQMHVERMEGRTSVDMIEQICLFMRIDKSKEMVLASLATQGMPQGQSPQQHLTNVGAGFHVMSMPEKVIEALCATIHSVEKHRLQLLGMLDSGKISTFREATNEARSLTQVVTQLSLVTPTFGYAKAALQ